jgi:hypothetical protein
MIVVWSKVASSDHRANNHYPSAFQQVERYVGERAVGRRGAWSKRNHAVGSVACTYLW